MCILLVYAWLRLVSYYDLSVLSMSVMGFQKNWMGLWGELYPVLFWIVSNFAKPLRQLGCNIQSAFFIRYVVTTLIRSKGSRSRLPKFFPPGCKIVELHGYLDLYTTNTNTD